ncbi:DUF4230 domain-containing protein [Pelovirga terrestris]|uniref:DUF4230 domain-containing protein n=1 Tax=Pelovirga terrestris TaxID=2771352 RepID=A0A8J6UHM2_9BACT|nr:DUF4230 domain-containing protein [Pelovirga terrestris]MBD1401668.1 hypothetical protein [Pelovirga terrestris]
MKILFVLLLLLTGRRMAEQSDVLLLATIIEDVPQVAHLEVSYGLVFTHHQPNRIISDDYYVREDVARVYYGFLLDEVKIDVRHGHLYVRLPKPQKISVDRQIKTVRVTHPSYQPLDQNGNPIDIDAVMVSRLNEIEAHYEHRTVAMTRNLSRQYFTALAHRHGLKLKLTFAD